MKYRFKDLKPDDEYYAQWVEFKKRYDRYSILMHLVVLFFLLPIPIALAGYGNLIYGVFIALIVFALLSFWDYFGLQAWLCPRCKQSFTGEAHPSISRFERAWCCNCELPRWAPNGHQPPRPEAVGLLERLKRLIE